VSKTIASEAATQNKTVGGGLGRSPLKGGLDKGDMPETNGRVWLVVEYVMGKRKAPSEVILEPQDEGLLLITSHIYWLFGADVGNVIQ